MRDIRAMRRTAADDSAFAAQPNSGDGNDARNLLPEQQHLPAYYQALRQRGQVSMDGVYAILRDLNDRVEQLQGSQQKADGPAPSQTEEDTQE